VRRGARELRELFVERIGTGMARGEEKPLNTRTVWIPAADHELLTEIKDSVKGAQDSLASLVRLYIRMGLLLHRNGIQTIDQLETLLERFHRSETGVEQLWEQIAPRIEAMIREK